jgi:type IV secretory pathway VirB9-like protein
VRRFWILAMIPATLFASQASAQEVTYCKKIYWKPNAVYRLKGVLHQDIHIVLPERIMPGTRPIAGNEDLWDPLAGGTHVWVKPNSNEPEGRETTLTVIGESNTSYEFILTRVSSDPDKCITILRDEIRKIAGLSDYKPPSEKDTEALHERIKALEAKLQQGQTEQGARVTDALKKYRSLIYTRYKWSEGTGFMGKNLVRDVYDDGRFTYIRVVDGNRGLLAVTAEIDGKKEMIEYQHDTKDLYRIAGIYPRFDLKYADSEVSIERRDNSSNGSY